jgi:membrane protease subunit (stomatin/prohibitin family)
MDHFSGHCPAVASTVGQIEGYQQHLERKFWEQAYCAIASSGQHVKRLNDNGMVISNGADGALDEWRKRWGRK